MPVDLMSYARLPTQQEATQGEKFQRLRHFGYTDCSHECIQAPCKIEYLFVNTKGFHSINVQAVCNADMKLTDVVVRWYRYAHEYRY